MPIRFKLLVLISLIFAALLINLITLGYLGRTTLVAFSTINDANDQLATAISMQAQMRGAEAALYRYLMEGVEGFAAQYQSQIKEFDNSLEVIRSSPLYRDNPALVDELMQVFHEANVVGNQLLQLRYQLSRRSLWDERKFTRPHVRCNDLSSRARGGRKGTLYRSDGQFSSQLI
jgi:CHASE3 domain sensor protein